MSKTLHTANGILCGLRPACLAALGFTAAEDILAGDRGLLGAMTSDNYPEVLIRALSWESRALLTNSLEPYARCRYIHAMGYCAQLLQGEYRLESEYIARIMDHTHQVVVNTVDNPELPIPYDYKFSDQYCTAVMLVYDHLGESAFTPEVTPDLRV